MSSMGAGAMEERRAVDIDTHDEEGDESFLSELDWDDIAEAFLGSLLAGIVLLLLLRLAMRAKHRRG